MLKAILNWLVYNWDQFCLWIGNQPTFIEVAFGVGLFYLALQVGKATYRLLQFLFSSLFSTVGRFGKQRNFIARVKSPKKKPVALDDDVPPFVFR
jgi:hypothetical protein